MHEVDTSTHKEDFPDLPIPVEMGPINVNEFDTYEPWFLIRNQELRWGE
jgi:hypothetical protein